MFGGVKGSYGKYSVGPDATNLSPAQFNTMANIEEQQRRRYQRRHEPGFVGNGYWYWNYPNMIGTIGAGSLIPTQEEHHELQEEQTRDGQTAPTTSGMGDGGTAASASGAAGGSPA
jgi:hypothetical protein